MKHLFLIGVVGLLCISSNILSNPASHKLTKKELDFISAAMAGDLDKVIRMVVQKEVNINARTIQYVNNKFIFGPTALYEAASTGHFDIVRFLVEQGAITFFPDSREKDPLVGAAQHYQLPVVRYLVGLANVEQIQRAYDAAPGGSKIKGYLKKVLRGKRKHNT